MVKMVLSTMLTFLVYFLSIFHGVTCLEPEKVPPQNVFELPWWSELCCHTPAAHPDEIEGSRRLSECYYTNSTRPPPPPRLSENGECLDIFCSMDGSWENLICHLKSRSKSSDSSADGLTTISLQRLASGEERDENISNGTDGISCVGDHSITCHIALRAVGGVVMVTVNVSDTAGLRALLRLPPLLGKPDPPVKLTHSTTTDGDVLLSWSDPLSSTGPLHYEVRYSNNTSQSIWKHVEVNEKSSLPLLDLKPEVSYTVQVRCLHPNLPLWQSDWSEPHHILLDDVTYIPEKMVVRQGAEVTVRCVFNDRSVNSSTVVWFLNLLHTLPQSQHTAVNDRISQITLHPSKNRLYDTLQCYQPIGDQYELKEPYAQIYIQGAAIDIICETNGDLDAMICRWNNSHKSELTFRSRWEDITCDIMEEERCEEELSVGGRRGVTNASTCQVRKEEGGGKSCTLLPLRLTSCYELWLELSTEEGPVRSHPVYITPIEHVKPRPPARVEALVLPTRVLKLLWVPPALPLYELQYQVRYTAVRALPQWQVLGPLSVHWAEVQVLDVCEVYMVQVRCMHANGTGYWSEWTEVQYSTALNSQAPKQGPDFWRVLQEDQAQNKTHVTLHFKHLTSVEPSHCIEGLVVQHQASGDTVATELIGLVPSYAFEWKEEVHSVTVKARNRLGSSDKNINMTLNRIIKRQCLRWFSASLVNSSCVGLSWGLQPNSSAPMSLVVQWSSTGTGPQGRPSQATESSPKWARLSPTDRVFYLHGDFYGSEEYEFILYPVFADGEGEPMHTNVTRGNPAAYMLLMIISILFIGLFVPLVISQNQMKKLVWKDVPNPNKCSWAQGLDFQKAETIDHLFKYPEGIPAWPLLLVSETISEVVILEKTGPHTSPALSPAPAPVSVSGQGEARDGPSQVTSSGSASRFGEETLAGQLLRTADISAQSSVTYATVLSSEPRLRYKQESGCSSSDEGNFSANNSDISGSFPGALWDLENTRAGESDPRRSSSFNSVEEFSETSEQEDEVSGEEREGTEKNLYYLRIGCQEEEESEEEDEEVSDEETKAMLLKEVVVESEANPLLRQVDSRSEAREEASGAGLQGLPLYLPQFRTAPNWPLTAGPEEGALQL